MMSDPRLGTEVAGHRLEGVIGRGGMSVVYLAEHLGLRRKVAFKVLGPELAEDEAFRERFIRESRITAGLDHPNIVTVYDAGEADGILYISMRYVEGTDLERLLRIETRLAPDRAISIVSQSAAALEAAHAEGLVHRDVKPGNILLTAERRTSTDRAYLSDFGVTKRMHTGAGLTRTGQFVGTVDYVAPEQIQSDDVDRRADEYSLACVLYRCLTGEVPFPRDTEIGTIYAHLQDRPPLASDRWPELPSAIDAPIARALAKSRDERFPTCRSFSEAAAAAISPTPVDVTPSEPTRAKTSSRRLVVTGAVILTAAAGIAIASALFLSSRTSGDGSTSATPPRALPQLTWNASADAKGVFDGPHSQSIEEIVSADGTVVAVGHNEELGDSNAAVWIRPRDRWIRVPGESFGRYGDQRMGDVTVFGGDLVAVGSERAGGATDPVVWRSSDAGGTWIRIDSVTSGLHAIGHQAGMQTVVGYNDGLVAAGFERSEGSLDAEVWTSPDGITWKWVSLSSFGGAGDQQILGATTLGTELVVVGFATTPAGDLDAAVWVESNGEWFQAEGGSLGGPGDQRISDVVAGGPGLIAVGSSASDGASEAAVWTSADGRSWDRVPTSNFVGSSASANQRMFTVARLGDVFVAGGSSAATGAEADAAIWLSSDGVHWRDDSLSPSAGALGGPGRQQIRALVQFEPGRLLAAGSTSLAHDEQAAVWVATVAFPSPSPSAQS